MVKKFICKRVKGPSLALTVCENFTDIGLLSKTGRMHPCLATVARPRL